MAFFNVQNGDAMLRPLGAPEKQEHSAKPSGQYRAMVYGIHGNFGILSNVESATCRAIWMLHSSSPTSGTPCFQSFTLIV
jgi:hypothetical protein